MRAMYYIKTSLYYRKWFDDLADSMTQKRILARLARIRLGNFGDTKSVGGGVSELRMPFGSGYRIYYAIQENVVIILLCAGDKSSQNKDIELAKKLLNEGE